MCAPAAIAIVSLSLSAAQQTASYVSQKKEANRTEAEQKAYEAENTRQVVNAQRLEEADLLHRQSQELLATAAQKTDAERQTTMDLSTERVAAAEAGVGGNSVDAVLNDIKTQGSREQTRLDVNSGITQDQLQREKAGTIVSAQNAINSVRPIHVNKPSILTPVLNIGGTALQVYDYAQTRTQRAKATNTNQI